MVEKDPNENIGLIKKPNVHEVSKTSINEYKETLAKLLIHHQMSADTIAADNEMKQYIENYAVNEVINVKTKDAIQGIVKKFAHMEVRLPDGNTQIYPVIHCYKGHNLASTTFFYKDTEQRPTHGTIEIERSPIIIP